MKIKHPVYFGQLLHKRGFKDWFLYLFRQIEGRKFIVEPIHQDLFQLFQDIYDLKTTRDNINVPPRSAKTTLAKYFIAYTLAMNPKANFIYTSFSQELLSTISRELASILTNPVYMAMYDQPIKEAQEESNPINEFWQEYLQKTEGKSHFTSRKITTKENGVVLFASIGSTITGLGAGCRGTTTFSGALVCFDYNELVLTEIGYLKIGDLVEKEIDVKIYSYNFNTEKNELQKISKYIKVENKEIIEVHLNNKKIIKCTPDHKIYIKNKGWIEAKNLIHKDSIKTFSNSFNLKNSQIKFFSYIFSRIIFISNFFKIIVRKFFDSSRLVISFVSKVFKRFFTFNVNNCSRVCLIRFSYISNLSSILSYFNNIFSCQITSRKNKCSMLYSILHIFRFSTINKIFKFIIRWIPIKMSSFSTFKRLLSYKRKQNKLVNSKSFNFTIFTKIDNWITPTKGWFKFFCRKSIGNFSKFSFPSVRKYITKIRNFVKSFITRDVFVDKIIFSHKIQDVYCISVMQNNNFFIKKCQDLLVHNCDDGNKPSDIHSQTMRNRVKTYFEETLLSRLNESNTPIINIQQRLHLQDLSGFLIETYKFRTLKKPLIVDGVCQIPSQYTKERIEELQKNEYMFSAQYQQAPIMAGGNLFKKETIKEISKEELPNNYEYRFITGDLSYKSKEQNDYTCFCYWGVEVINSLPKLYLIDAKRKKINAVDVDEWIDSWIASKITTGFRYICIEDKSHGIYLNQKYRKKGYPVPSEEKLKELLPARNIDKIARANNSIPCLNSNDPNLIINKDIENWQEMKDELLSFPNADHDDFCFVKGTKIATKKGDVEIENIKKGDLILTPFGFYPVEECGQTGEKEVITKYGLKGTKNHKVFTFNDDFVKMDNLIDQHKLSKLTLCNILKTTLRKLLNSMELNIEEWEEKENITCLNPRLMQGEEELKVCMLQFMNFIAGKKFPKAGMFIIKMVTHLTIALTTWSVYRVNCTIKSLKKLIKINKKNILQKFESLRLFGIRVQKAELGIVRIQKESHTQENIKFNANHVLQYSQPQNPIHILAQLDAKEEEQGESIKKEKVYNLKINKIPLYYANGILVHNCDNVIDGVHIALLKRKATFFDIL